MSVFFDLFVTLMVLAGLPLPQELRPGVFGLADENHVRQITE